MSLSARRAWIEMRVVHLLTEYNTSLSARRAWIEMPTKSQNLPNRYVALRKESVDRNLFADFVHVHALAVALRKESVDRNGTVNPIVYFAGSRSPQGERG